MARLSYDPTSPIGTQAVLGLIALRADETIEHDFRRFFGDDTAIASYVTRILSAPEVTEDTLRQMESALPTAAGLLPPTLRFDAIGYGCTSAAALIGPDRVAELVASATDTAAVTNPLSAALAAFKSLGAKRVALLSPYVQEVSSALVGTFAAQGIETVSFASFDEREEARVARIDPASILAGAIAVAKGQKADAVFLSCTNLRTLDIIKDAEDALGIPVVSSNQALFWQMGRAANLPLGHLNFGRLMRA